MTSTNKRLHPLPIFFVGLALGVLLTSIIYSVYLSPTDCKGDGLCESGQTLFGSVFWGVLVTSYILPPLMVIALAIWGGVKLVKKWLKGRRTKRK